MGRDTLTQVGRALRQLGIERIAAYSPEARWRSERMFATLQKHLTQELRLAAITDIDERTYQPVGFETAVPGSLSGNCAAFSIAGRICRTWLAASRSFGATCHRPGYTMMTGFPRSAVTMRIGVRRSVSFEMTAAASNSPFQASFRR